MLTLILWFLGLVRLCYDFQEMEIDIIKFYKFAYDGDPEKINITNWLLCVCLRAYLVCLGKLGAIVCPTLMTNVKRLSLYNWQLIGVNVLILEILITYRCFLSCWLDCAGGFITVLIQSY